MDSNNQGEQLDVGGIGRRRLGIAVIAVAVVGAASIGIWKLAGSDSDDEATAGVTETTQSAGVSDSDEGTIEVPQNPSLMLVDDAGTLHVENDGNVTMSGVEVRDAAGSSVCSIGTISPGDRQECEATVVLRPATAVGSGPQGQQVESVLE